MNIEEKVAMARVIKRSLRKDTVISEIKKIAHEGNDWRTTCALRDCLLHELTGFWWDEISL
jgi:hypothetical protein